MKSKYLKFVFILMYSMFSMEIYSQPHINSMYIYSYFEQKGISSAGAYSQLNDLKEKKINRINITEKDIQQFEKILSFARCKKHHQIKLGIDNVFGCMSMNGKPINFVICSNTLVFDMTNSCNYWIEEKSDKEWLILFINRIKTGSD